MMKFLGALKNEPNVYRSKWSRNYSIRSSLSRFSVLPEPLSLGVIQTEYTREPPYGCNIFSGSAPRLLHKMGALQSYSSCLSVRKKEPSLPTVKLWIICSSCTPQMPSAPRRTTTWCIFRSYRASHLQIVLKPLEQRTFRQQSIWRLCIQGNFYWGITGINSTQHVLILGLKVERYSTRPDTTFKIVNEVSTWFVQYLGTPSSRQNGYLTLKSKGQR